LQEFDTRLEVEVVHVVSDPEPVLCRVSAAVVVVVVEAKLRLSRSSVRSSTTGSMAVAERMVAGSGLDNWGFGMRVWRGS
jgi:hypothetical protein